MCFIIIVKVLAEKMAYFLEKSVQGENFLKYFVIPCYGPDQDCRDQIRKVNLNLFRCKENSAKITDLVWFPSHENDFCE